jgi:hypothetical protein
MATGNSSFTTFLTSTLQKYRRTLQENLMGQQALFWQLKQRGFVTEEKGGRSIVVPLMYGTNDTVSSYQGYDLLDVTPQAGITAAEYDWKYIAGSVTISGQEEFENSGDKERIFNLLEAKIKQLEISMKLELNQQLFAVGSGNGGKDITGLDLAVQDGTTWSEYGGIDSAVAANSWWRNQWQADTGTDFLTEDGTSVNGMTQMRGMFNDCTVSNEKPSLIVTTSDLYEQYEAHVEGSKLRTQNTKMADAGFINQEFKGVPMIFDEDMQADEMLFLNSDYLKFVIGKGRNFTSTPFVKPENQDAKVSHVLFTGNIVTSKRDVHGRITSFTATA